MNYYQGKVSEIAEELQTDIVEGLTSAEAKARLEKYGRNELIGKKNSTLIQKFIEQLKDVMVIVLLIAAAISFVLAVIEGHGEYIDSIIILLIVILNASLGVMQESNAEKALDALKEMSAPFATIIRDGNTQKVASKDVVKGDIVLLEAGDLVPADGRLIESASLQSEESALTGESVPVTKDIKVTIKEDAPIGDRLNMVYSGCNITYGRGRVLITGTGMDTEMGKIAGLLNETESELTPLQVKLDKLGKQMGLMALLICVFVFILGVIKKEPLMEMFMTSVSLAVAAIPEGLATVVTLVLATGVQKMVKNHAIMRKLPAVETLGSASVICSDKTGTLTQNKMTVQKVWAAGSTLEAMTADVSDEAIQTVLFSALCNDSRVETIDGKTHEIGDPTEIALIVAGERVGMFKSELEKEYPRIGEIPFDSERKLMSTVHETPDGRTLVVVKGGFDVLLPLCIAGEKDGAEAINLELGKDALRVLAIAYKEIDALPKHYTTADLESDLTFVGLVGMIDPPREESKDAIAVCKAAGIKTVMITGDHIVTASAIAKELGILTDDKEAISGADLNEMTQEQLIADVRKYSVYARVSPEDKIRIVQAWQANGEVVAMTGDGVNDAPALKAADIGCAMGITGTEVAKGAADMVLTDDNFATIVTSVKEGRTIYANIRKTIEFLLGSNIGEVLVVFIAMLMDWGTPLIAIQLLMINVVTDAFPAFALGFEEAEDSTMTHKPIPKDEGVFAGGLGLQIGIQGVVVAILTLTAFYAGKFLLPVSAQALAHSGGDVAIAAEAAGRTMAFLTLTLSQLVHAYNCRSEESLFKVGFFGNKYMNMAFLGSLTIALAITLVPFLEDIFKMVDLTGIQWIIVAGLSISIFFIVEIEKLIMNRTMKK